MNNYTTPTNCSQELFHPIVHAILADYLQVERLPCATGINLEDEVEQDWNNENQDGVIRPRPTCNGDVDDGLLENAVARLVLNGIENRLPQWAAVYADGQILLGRTHNRKRKGQLTLLPQFLFEINWADSGPGYSWPEQYHVAYVPGYHRYVVTASQDSPDTYGYEDIAIGQFPAETPLEAGCRQAIIDWWRQLDRDPDLRWQDFWSAGLFNDSEAYEWADVVWGSCEPTGDEL